MTLLLVGCAAEPYGRVAELSLGGERASLWAPEGRLRTAPTELALDLSPGLAEGARVPPRLVFEKRAAGSGFRLRREVTLRAESPLRWRGRIALPEPGAWEARLEVGERTVRFPVEVAGVELEEREP